MAMPTSAASVAPFPAATAPDGAEPSRPACLRAILRFSGLRPTRQRLDIADRLIGRDRHITAEQLFNEMRGGGQEMSLATVYNTLRQFRNSGLVRELALDGSRSVFDTDTSGHHHFFFETESRIIDLPPDILSVSDLPNIPEGYEVSRVEVTVRLRRKSS
jgi:Fur family transcriptional regulator, iron response regulator